MSAMMRRICLACLFAVGLSSAATAQQAAADHLITGFRSAHWGMTADETRAAIAKDFHPASQAVTVQDNPAEGTSVIQLHLDQLEPGPGPATVNYVMGAKSRRLMHINVTWSYADNATTDERGKIAAAGLELAAYFRGQSWKPNGSTVAVPAGPNTIVLFAGIDPKGAGVELDASGVALQTNGKSQPPPTGPTLLRISYSADILHPDILTIPPGHF